MMHTTRQGLSLGALSLEGTKRRKQRAPHALLSSAALTRGGESQSSHAQESQSSEHKDPARFGGSRPNTCILGVLGLVSLFTHIK